MNVTGQNSPKGKSSRRSPKKRKSSGSSKKSSSPEPVKIKEGLVDPPAIEKPLNPPVIEKTENEVRYSKDEICIWHHQPLTLYCEIREEPLCTECLNNQYKNTQHKIVSIDEAYRFRIASIYNTLSVHLFGRKEQLEAQARRIEFRVDELLRVKNVVERDMQSEFRGINERLGSSFNANGGLVQSDIQSLTEDLEHINFIIGTLENSDQDFIKFLKNFKPIKQELEKSISKPFRTDIKVLPSDLPRELDQIRGLSTRAIGLQALVDYKNELIWKFLHERVPSCKVPPEIEKELKQWAELSEKFSKELEKYQLKCEFCGVVLDDENVNGQCLKNSSYSLSVAESSKYPAGFKGNSRHYFVKIPEATKEKTEKKPKYADVDDKVLQKISKAAREKDIDLDLSFKQYDMLNTGFLFPTDFYYLMVEAFQLTGEEITELIFRYDKNREGKIRYLDIIEAITAKLPQPFQKLRDNAGKVLELCKKKDRLVEGALNVEGFKDVLRQIGLGSDEIEDVLKVVSSNKRGKVLYLEFHDKII